MSRKNFKICLLFVGAVLLTLGLSVSFQSLLAAWTAPLANPPTCVAGNPGCDAPLNTGALMQTKGGGLWINTGVSPTGLIVEKGNVGIGNTDPTTGAKLHVTQGSYAYDDLVVESALPSIRLMDTELNQKSYGILADGSNLYIDSYAYASRAANSYGSHVITISGDNVGIGTNSAGYKLTVNGSVGVFGDMVENQDYGLGLVGAYSPYRYSNVYSMGPAYRLATDGTTSGNLYGIAYSYEPGYGGAGNNAQAKAGLGHQYLIMANGSTVTALGNGVWTSGNVQAGGNLYLSGSAGNYLYNDGTYIKAANYLRAGLGIYSDGWMQTAVGQYMYSGGNFVQAAGYPVYPGSVYGLGNWQTSYYIASHAQWGIYTNTSFNAEGGVYSRGSAVLTSVSSFTLGSCEYVDAGYSAICPAGKVLTAMDRNGCGSVYSIRPGVGGCWATCCAINGQ